MYMKYSKAYLELLEKRHYRRYYRRQMYVPEFWTRKRWYQEHGIDITYLSPPFGERANISNYSRNPVQRLGCNIEYNNGTIINKLRYSSKRKTIIFIIVYMRWVYWIMEL